MQTPTLNRQQQTTAAIEIQKIVDGGDQANRIDVVFMGDGYSAAERDQFFDDIRRLTNDMFNGDTFRSYLPLFNIHAVHVESEESGIGYNGPKNTPFRLYRSAGQLRGISTGNASYAREVKLKALGPKVRLNSDKIRLGLSINWTRRMRLSITNC